MAGLDGTRVRSFVFGVLAVVVVIGVGVVAFLLAGGGDDLDVGAPSPPPSNAPREATTEGDGGTSPATTARPTPTTNLGDLVTSHQIVVSDVFFELPDGWITAPPGSGAQGAQLFPDDPQLASAFDTNLQHATDSGALLFGLESDLSSEGLLQVHLLDSADIPGGLDQAAANGRAALPTQGARLDEDQPIATADGAGHIFRYRFPGASGEAYGVQLLVPVGPDVYVLTFSTASASLADQLVGVAATCRAA